MPRKEKGFLVLAALFIAALIICNIITFKLGILWNVEALSGIGLGFMVVAAGILPYPFTFLVTDLLSEVYGKTRANYVVVTGFIVSLFVLIVILIAGALKPLPKPVWKTEWHLVRTDMKLGLTPTEKKKLTPIFNEINGALPSADPEDRKALSHKLEDKFINALSDENREQYLTMQAARREYSRSYYVKPDAGDPGDRHLGQSYLADPFIEFFLFFPEVVPDEIKKQAVADKQPLHPVIPFQTAYDQVFGQTFRAIMASMIAYLIAQLIDVRLFHFWKRLTKGRFLWLRNNASTFSSQVIDTFLVIFMLFYGTEDVGTLLSWVYAGIVFKWAWALLDTPLLYLGVYLFKRYLPEAFAEGEAELQRAIAKNE